MNHFYPRASILAFTSEIKFFYKASCSSTHFWSSDSEILGFGGHSYEEIKEFVITDKFSTPELVYSSEMNFFYKASCSSTHFWSSDSEILGFGGHLYEEIKSLLSQMNHLSLGLVYTSGMNFFYKVSCSSTYFWSSDSGILGFGGHLYEEIKILLSQINYFPKS